MSTDKLGSMKVDNVATGMLPGLDALGICPTSPARVAQEYVHPAHDRKRLDALPALSQGPAVTAPRSPAA